MNKFISWFLMGGYAIYIWPAYGLVCMGLLLNVFGVKRQSHQTKNNLRHWFKRQAG